MAAGSGVTYPLLSLVSLPTAVNGTETVALGVSLPTGFSLTFVPSSVTASTDPHYLGYATMTINSTQNVAPGIYNFTVGAFYGTSATKTSLRVEVVNYLVVIPNNVDEFTPNNLTVKVGGTVYWFNADLNNPFNVAFSSGSTVQSPTIQPYTAYSYTFTSPGTYSYHDTTDPGMTGTITVTP